MDFGPPEVDLGPPEAASAQQSSLDDFFADPKPAGEPSPKVAEVKKADKEKKKKEQEPEKEKEKKKSSKKSSSKEE
eukprot:2015072-Rhodomonas_salina.1